MITLNRDIQFYNPDVDPLQLLPTAYLLGCIGSKITADIRIDVSWSTQAVNMRFVSADSTIERLDSGISSWISDGFKVGDTIVITGTASNNLTQIIQIVTDNLITTTAPPGTFTNETVIANVWGETPIIAMDFYPNLIANSSPFSLFNLTDRETIPRYSADTISASAGSPTVMQVTTNSKGWVTPHDSATIYRLSFTNHIQTFVIRHTFDITPIYLAGQLKNLQQGMPPAAGSFQDIDCLKYIFKADGKFVAYNPSIPHTSDGNIEFLNGQTGWFNEFLNGRPTKWTKESLAYSDSVTGTSLPAIDYCKVVNGEAHLQHQTSYSDLVVELIIMYLPTDESEYINKSTDYKTNFIYERALVTLSSGTIQGENTGDYHFLKNVVLSFLSTSRVKLTFQVDFSTLLTTLFDTKDSDNLNYLVFATIQNASLNSNSTALILDVNQYACDKDDSTLFQIIDEVQFFEYPYCNGTGYSNFNVFPRDTVLTKTQFYVKQGTAIDPIILKNIGMNLVAVKQNEIEEFPLETFNINTSGFLPNCDNIQEIIFNQDRDFILPDGDCRNRISLFRMPTLDVTGYSAYELIYPFKVRWEDWRKLQGASRCFPNATQNWMVYGNLSGWSIKFNITAQIEDSLTEHTTEFEHITWGNIKDPCDVPYSGEFNTFDSTGVNNYEEVVADDADTFVEATVSGDFSGFTESQLYGILTLDAWGVGGVAYAQEIGTRINVDSAGVWYGAGSSLVATLTKVSNSTVKLSAYLNYLYLPTDTNQFILSARIGEFNESVSSSGASCLNEITIYAFTCGQFDIEEVTDANTLIVSGQVQTADFRNVFVENLILTFVTSTTWTVSGGTIDENPIILGTVGGNVIKAPAHPYTNANVGDTLQGSISGNIYSSQITITGIGDMQIGCTFFVS